MLSFSSDQIALVSICLAALMFGLEISSVPVVLPLLEKELQSSIRDMQCIMAAYTIGCAIILNISGSLADRFGRRTIFCIAIAAFGATSLMCGLAGRSDLLIVARLSQGIAGGAMLTCVVAILNSQFPDGLARSRAFGTWGVVFGAGLGLGPILGAMIIHFTSWRWTFYIHTIISFLTLFLVRRSVRETRNPTPGAIDIGGMVSLSISMFLISYVVVSAPSIGWTSNTLIILACLALISSILFVFIQYKSSSPTIDFTLFRIRSFSGAILGAVGMNFSFWPFMVYYPLYLEVGLGLTSFQAGVLLLAYTLPAIASPPLGEALALKWGPELVIPWGLLVCGLGFLFMLISQYYSIWLPLSLVPGSVAAGIGVGLINTLISNTSTKSVPANQAGMASGMDTSAKLVTLSIIISVMGLILIQGISSNLYSYKFVGLNYNTARAAAEALAAGDINAVRSYVPQVNAETVRLMFMSGFVWVTMFAFLGVVSFAIISFFVFPRSRIRTRP